MRGRVLDIGGVKGTKRGRFTPPRKGVEKWKYLNLDPNKAPDYCCSAENIPLNAASFDTVIMTEVIEYLDNPGKAFEEIFRVLSANGVALVSAPLLMAVHGDWKVDKSRFTAIKLKEMASAAGFQSVEIRTMGGLGSVFSDLIHVAGGYANDKKKTLTIRVLFKVSKAVTPFFRWLNRVTKHIEDYVTTGYFIVLRKG
jgi:SAM-dependent methyltransferase